MSRPATFPALLPGPMLWLCLMGVLSCSSQEQNDDDTSSPTAQVSPEPEVTPTPESSSTPSDNTLCAQEPKDSPCRQAPQGLLFLCIPMLYNTSMQGHFEQWSSETDVRFVSDSNQEYEVWLEGDAAVIANIPNLSDAGDVVVTQQGGCDGEGGYYNAISVENAASTELILLTGSSATSELASWSISAESDTESCPACSSDTCNEFLHNRPIDFTSSDGSLSLYQGSTGYSGDYLVHAGRSQTASGLPQCADVGTEYTNWYIIPAVDSGG